MAQLIALRPFRYGTRQLRAGDTFDASMALARFYCTVGRARPYQPRPQAPEAIIDVRTLDPIEEAPARKRRTYKRRDMRAEG